ncbi:islet cell autoantigen 1-like isoform X1 [Erpetoichthys calabaricus]|uniref:Islet cell autoantigen 1-like n=1 Tax=Erpetoichthys calabaricus TaxID=27687 RepID=A0A8C4S288_ERPCA|nr:islet cell autoantigen 1-like isoform X1 [Erpetoichthys calabaricus]
MDGYSADMYSRHVLAEDSSVMARMQKKFWKTKQVLIKATGKKEDEHVVASDADLDAKLEFFRSLQTTCLDLLKVVEKYQQRINCLSVEENELGLFLQFHAERDRSKAGDMMEATSKALCASANQRLALVPPLHRLEQEVETFRRRAISDTLITVERMEKARTEYRGALLWMKDVSQELDPDTYKQLEKFRKVQAQVRNTKMQFEKLKNDVCQKVDILGASRCNMLSHSLGTYQMTLLHFWEKTALMMSQIEESFSGHMPYEFTTLKDLQDPLNQLVCDDSAEKLPGESPASHLDKLIALNEEQPPAPGTEFDQETGVHGKVRSGPLSLSLETVPRDLLGDLQEAGDSDRTDLTFLKELWSPAPVGLDELGQDWYGAFEGSSAEPPSSPTGFLPSQLLDRSLSATGWTTPPMFKAQAMEAHLQEPTQSMAKTAPQGTKTAASDMSAWFNLFADLDPLSNPDAIGRTDGDLLNA